MFGGNGNWQVADPRVIVHNEDTYLANRAEIERLQAALNKAAAINEQGKRNFEQLENELKRKAQEGEDAQRKLDALRHSRNLLTYPDSNPPAATANVLALLNYSPVPPNPAPSARIEEVPSPGRNFNPQPSTFYQGQANYSGGYQEQPRGYDQMSQQSFQLYEQSRSSQNVHAGSSTQGGQAHSYMAPTQPHMFALPRSTPPFIPPSDSRPHQSARATLQPNSRPPTYQQTSQSNSGQRPSPAPSYPQPTTQTHPSHTMAAKPPQSQSQSNPFETPASRTSQPRESPFAAPAQPPRTTPQPPNPQRQSSTPQGQRPQAVEQPLAVAPRTTIVPQPQNSQRQSSTPQVQRPQANQQPLTVAPSVTITPQSQRQPSAPQVPQPQNRPPATLAHSTQPTQSTSRPAQSQPPAPTPTASGSRPVDSQQSQALQKVATDAAHKPSDPAPSYGMSPFAHNPVPKTQPNPTPAPPAQQPVASSATSAAPSHTAIVPANTQPLATTSQDLGHFPRFLSLIDMWQRASPPLSYLDIPHANVRVKKSPSGEIRFFCPDLQTHEQVWISPEAAFQRLRFQGAARIFVNPRGLNELLQVPLPKALENSYKSYTGITVTNAPVATFPSPPGPSPPVPMQKPTPTPVSAGYTPAVRTPRQADKRFMAHDILRALGKTPLDDDRVQYAKRRAVEAPQVAEEPVVMARISSNEPSAKSTPSTSRTSTPAPSMPVPVPVPVSLQMQVPPWQVPMFAATPLLQSAPPQQIPLFLPASPPPTFTRRAKSPPSRSAKLTFDYVLIPPAPPHVKQDLARRRSRRTPEPMVVDEPPIEDVSMLKEGEEGGEPEPEREPEIDLMELKRRRARGMYQNTENEEEQAAMLEACTRMREVPCRWFACTSVLNSLENVVTHLHEVHAQEDMDLTTCMWDVCGESFATSTQLALHAETHVLGAIPCPYQDCDEIFPSPRELVAHNGLGHADQNSSGESVPPRPLLPSMRPSAPEEASLALPAVPQSAPTWELHLPEVGMPHISGDRHKTLGPWVARNISAPATNVRARRYNAAVQLKTSSSSAFQPNYEFVEMSSRHYSSLPSRPARVPEMADLNSKDVSDWLAKGELVLWPPEEGFEAEELMEEGSTSSTVVEQTRMLEKTLDDEAEKAAVPQWNTDEHSTSLPVENTELALTQPLWGTEKTVDGEIQLSGAADEEMAVENMLQEELDDLQNVA